MRKVSVFIAICFVFACARGLTGQSEQNQNALKNIMKQVDPAWTSLQKNLDSGNAAGVATDASRLQRLFDAADRFFTKMNMEQPAGWAKAEAAAAGTAAKTPRTAQWTRTPRPPSTSASSATTLTAKRIKTAPSVSSVSKSSILIPRQGVAIAMNGPEKFRIVWLRFDFLAQPCYCEIHGTRRRTGVNNSPNFLKQLVPMHHPIMPLGKVAKDFIFAVGQVQFVSLLARLEGLQIHRDVSEPDSRNRRRGAP
jgi:hypothetical protein